MQRESTTPKDRPLKKGIEFGVDRTDVPNEDRGTASTGCEIHCI